MKEFFSVKLYQFSDYSLWNTFISKAKNATFLFHRDFMDYHSDRFQDYSLLIFKEESLLAVLPANRQDKCVYSHQGLTYGGLVTMSTLKTEETISLFTSILHFLETQNISELKLKVLPSIYTKQPSDEMKYLAFKLRADLYRRDMLSVIDYSAKNKSLSTIRKRGIKRAEKNNLMIKEESNFKSFWNQILIPNLQERFQTKPVHSLAEIELLASKFPNAIRQFNVYKDDKLVAGTTIFETDLVAHAQYIAGDENKQELGSLDFLFNHLITNVFKSKKYFDFGISNENNGESINSGLLYWKESFGARTITQDFYSFKTNKHTLIDQVK